MENKPFKQDVMVVNGKSYKVSCFYSQTATMTAKEKWKDYVVGKVRLLTNENK